MTTAGPAPGRGWAQRLLRPFEHRAVSYPSTAAIVLVASWFSIWLRLGVPNPFGRSPYDTILYVKEAGLLRAHAWLGPYGQLTLAKVPGYPLFAAACNLLHIPLKAGEQLVNLMAAALVGVCLLLLTRRLVGALIGFLLIAFDPIYLTSISADTSRDSLFSSVSPILIASCFLAGYLAVHRRGMSRALITGLIAGLSLGACLLIREEGAAMIPCAAVSFAAAPIVRLVQTGAWRPSRMRGLKWSGIRTRPCMQTLAAVAVIVITGALPVAAVRAENQHRYGVALTSDYSEGSFIDAYAEWQRVTAGPVVPHVPITKAQREAVYRVSPAARLLEPFLENPDYPWHQRACAVRPDCDYPGAWTVWALRDAASRAGEFASATRAQVFFSQVAQDIAAACDDGRLACGARLPSSLEPLRRVTLAAFEDSAGRLARDLVTSRNLYEYFPAAPAASNDDIRPMFLAADPSLPPTAAAAAAQQARFAQRMSLYHGLDAVYTALLPIASAFGLVFLVGIIVTRRGRSMAGQTAALALALLFGVLTRLGLLAIVDAADYSAELGRYLYPAHALLLAFAVVSVGAAVQVFDRRRQPNLSRRPGWDGRLDAAQAPAVDAAPQVRDLTTEDDLAVGSRVHRQPSSAEREPSRELHHA